MSLRLTPRLASLAVLAVPVLGLLAACQPPPPRVSPGGGAGRADPAAAAYCRQRAEEMYETQNRSARIQADHRDSPFSGAYIPNTTTRGLSDRYAMDAMIADCMRNVASRDAGPDLGTAAPSQPAAQAARPAARPASPADLRPAAGAQAPLERAPPPPRP